MSSPLHSIQLYIFRHSLVVSPPFLQQSFQVTRVLNCELSYSLLLRRTCKQLPQLIKAHALQLDFGSLALGFGLGDFTIDKLVDVG